MSQFGLPELSDLVISIVPFLNIPYLDCTYENVQGGHPLLWTPTTEW